MDMREKAAGEMAHGSGLAAILTVGPVLGCITAFYRRKHLLVLYGLYGVCLSVCQVAALDASGSRQACPDLFTDPGLPESS